MRCDGRRAVVLAFFLATACTPARPADPPPEARATGCLADRFAGGVVPAARDASPACRDGDTAACEDECEHGVAWACAESADRAEGDLSMKRSMRACELGAMPVCTRVAALAFATSPDATPPPIAPSCARALLDVACSGRVPDACARLGFALVEGEGGDKNPGRGRDILERACDALGRSPCRVLGVLLRRGAFGTEERPLANRALRRACDTGDVEACALVRKD